MSLTTYVTDYDDDDVNLSPIDTNRSGKSKERRKMECSKGMRIEMCGENEDHHHDEEENDEGISRPYLLWMSLFHII